MAEKQDTRTRLLTESPVQLMNSLSLPAIIGMVVVGLYSFMDRVFVGQLIDEVAMTAVSVAYPFTLINSGISTLIGVGSASVLSRAVGKKDQNTIDKIMGQARRKKAWEGTLGEVQVIAPLDSYMLKDYEKPNMKVLDFGSHTQGAKVYGMIHQGEGGQISKIIFEPNEKILQHIRQRTPRKIIL